MNTHKVYFSLGANLGDKRATINEAITEISKQIGTVECRSAFYESEPWGFESANTFVNVCIRCSTTLPPHDILTATQSIERTLGRTRKSTDGEYHDRTIDIDILLYDNLTVDEPDLKIPHPLMNERDFVMIPLKEVLLT